MKILIVDDSPTARMVLVKCLKQLGHTDIVQAGDGDEGLEVAAKTPDLALVLLDRYMPKMDGFEFMTRFKANPANLKVPISMITSENDMDERFKAVADHKADYYITKPVTAGALVRMFARLFPDS